MIGGPLHDTYTVNSLMKLCERPWLANQRGDMLARCSLLAGKITLGCASIRCLHTKVCEDEADWSHRISYIAEVRCPN
jgi:hypothetical protein